MRLSISPLAFVLVVSAALLAPACRERRTGGPPPTEPAPQEPPAPATPAARTAPAAMADATGTGDAGISPAGARVTHGCEPGGAAAGAAYLFVDAAAPAGGSGAREAPLDAVQAGLRAVQKGQRAVICVAAGTYVEHASAAEDVFAAGTEITVVGGFQPGSRFAVRDSLRHVTTLRAPDRSQAALQIGNIRAFTLDGLAITGGLHGVLVKGGYAAGRSLTVRNCHVHGNGVEGQRGLQGAGMKLSAGRILVEHNLIEGNAGGQGGGGLSLAAAPSSEQNRLEGGALTIGAALARITRNIVQDNVLRHDTPHGAGVAVSMNAVIDHNLIRRNRGYPPLDGPGGQAVGGGVIAQHPAITVTISENRIEGNSAPKAGGGVLIDEGSIGTIVNNVIVGNEGDGAVAVDGHAGGRDEADRSYATIVNNTVVGNSRAAIFVQDSRAAILNNVFWKNGSVDFIVAANGGIAEAAFADHNLLSSVGGAGAGLELGGRNLRGQEPLLAGEGDLRPGERSPTLDAGAARFTPALAYEGALVAAPAADIDGVARPQGAGVDLGAFERGR